jgi:hypothetical protein
LNQLLHQRIIGYNQFLRFLASERIDPSDWAVTDGCSSTSSSHATAGSSCHSVSPSRDEVNPSHIDDGCTLDSIGYCNTDPFELNIILEEETEMEHPEFINEVELKELSPTSSIFRSQITLEGPMDVSSLDIAVAELVSQILGEGHDLVWLQMQVLEACHVKFRMESKLQKAKRSKFQGMDLELHGESRVKDEIISDLDDVSPVPHHYSRKSWSSIKGVMPIAKMYALILVFLYTVLGQSIPIIPWTHWQELLLMSPPYLLLLHKLGFHLPGDVGKLFPRIPHYWTSDVLLSVAGKLGPLPSNEKLKFDPCEVIQLMEETVSELDCSAAGHNDMMQTSGGTNIESSSFDESTLKMSTMGIGSGFMSPHTSYGFGSATQSVNWMTLVHKSKQLIDRHR